MGKIVSLVFAAIVLSGCGELGQTLGLSEKKSSGSGKLRSCYGLFYSVTEMAYVDHRNKVIRCEEDANSIQYRVYQNVCTGGDELIGYNYDAYGLLQYCSNSPCSMEDRKRGEKIYPNGQIEVQCGFSTPGIVQEMYGQVDSPIHYQQGGRSNSRRNNYYQQRRYY